MVRGPNLKPDQIAAITSLYQARHSNLEICALTGINERTVRTWTRKFRDAPDGEMQLQRKSTGRPREVGPRTLDIIRRQVDITPTLSARQIREENPELLSHVAIRTIQQYLCVDLGYRRRVWVINPYDQF